MKRRQIIKIEPGTNKIVGRYSSISDAARKNFISVAAIWHCLNGLSKTCCGCKWKYRDETNVTIIV